MGKVWIFNAILVALLVVTLIACEGGGSVIPRGAAPGVAGKTAPVHDLTMAEALAELDALAVTEGVDPKVFAQLKAALREALRAKGVSMLVSKAPVGERNQVDDLELIDNGDATYTLTWSYKNVGDYDLNGEVNINDLTPIGQYFQAGTGSIDWQKAKQADGNGDGLVTINDITPIAQNYMAVIDSYLVEGSNDDSPTAVFTVVATVPFSADTTGYPVLFAYDLGDAAYNYYRVTPTCEASVYPSGDTCSQALGPTGFGGMSFPVLAEVDNADVQAGVDTEVVSGNTRVAIYPEVVPPGSTVRLLTTAYPSQIEPEIVGEPFQLEIDGLDGPDDSIAFHIQVSGLPQNAQQGDYDLVRVVTDDSGLLGRLYAYANIYNGTLSKLVTYDPESVYYIESAAAKQASSELWFGYGDNRNDGVLVSEPNGDASRHVHVIFVHGLDQGDDGGITDWLSPCVLGNRYSKHWYKYCNPNDNPRAILSDPSLDVNLWWFYYPTVARPVFGDEGSRATGRRLAAEIERCILSNNPQAKIILVGYSMGATVSWAAYDYLGTLRDHVEALITLNGVNQGTEWVNIAKSPWTTEFGVFSSTYASNAGINDLRSIYDVKYDLTKYYPFWGIDAIETVAGHIAEALGLAPPQITIPVPAGNPNADLAAILSSPHGQALRVIPFGSNSGAQDRWLKLIGAESVFSSIVGYEGITEPIHPNALAHDGIVSFHSQMAVGPTENPGDPTHQDDHVQVINNRNAAVYSRLRQELSLIINDLLEIQPPDTRRGDWWMFGRDPQHTRRSPYVGAQTNHVKWSYETGHYMLSSPAIGADGTVYVGNDWGELYAIRPDGTLKWSYNRSTAHSSPAIGADGMVYVGSDDYNLYAIKPDGTLKWTYPTGYCVRSSPAIGADGTVYVGSDDNNLYAIKPDGTLKWRYLSGGRVESSPAIGADGTVYVGSWDGNLYGVNSDGTLKWTFLTGDLVESSPAIGADGTVYVGSDDNNLYAINPDGTQKWDYPAGDWVYSSPAIGADGTVYVGSEGTDDGNLYAIRPDGTLKWSYPTGWWVYSSPAIGADGTVYVGSNVGKLYAFGP